MPISDRPRSPSLPRGPEAADWRGDTSTQQWYQGWKGRPTRRSAVDRMLRVASRDIEWIKSHRKEQVKKIREIESEDDVFLFHLRRWFCCQRIQQAWRQHVL